MPMTITNTGNQINNIFPNNLNATMRDDAHDAIGALQYAQLFAGAGTLINLHGSTVRVDMQGHFNRGGFAWSNIQVQVNGVHGNSTVAHLELRHDSANIADPANQRGAVHKVCSALEQSLDTGNTWEVTGTLS